MRMKHLVILGIILLILSGILIVKKTFIKPEFETAEYKMLEISIEPETVYAIEINKPGMEKPFRMEKKEDGRWLIPSQWDVAARKERIESFLKELEGLSGELRSDSKKLFPDYGISEEEALTITLLNKDGVSRRRFFVGMKKPRFGKSFCRIDDSEEVYLVDKDIFSLLGIYGKPKDADIKPDMWANLSIADFNIDGVDSLKITRYIDTEQITTVQLNRTVDEEKQLKQWVAVGEEPLFDLDAKKIREYLRRITTLRASKIVDPEGEGYGLDSPYLTVTLDGKDGTEQLVVGGITEEGSEDRYVKNSGGQVFFIRKYVVENLDIDVSKFFVDNPLRVTKETITSVSVTAGDAQMTFGKDDIEEHSDYIDGLTEFSVKKLLFGTEGLPSSPAYTLTLTKDDGQTVVIDAAKGQEDTFVARLRGKDRVFEISNTVFKKIFEDIKE